MSDDGETPISRWSRLKRRARDGQDAPEAVEAPAKPKKRGSAAPVAGRRPVRSLPPLAGADQDPDDPFAGPPIIQAHGLPPEVAPPAADEAAGERALTPEEQEAVKDLPPIETLNKDSDFTPFLADKVPDFIRRKALSVLWRSDPVLANLDGLNDYDEDFTFAAVIAEALSDAKETRKAIKAAKRKAAKEKGEVAEAGDGKPAEAAEPVETADAGDDDVGEAEGDEVEYGSDDVRPPDPKAKPH